MNKSLTIENRQVIMHNFFKFNIFRGWNKYFKKNVSLLYKIVVSCYELNYYYSRLIIRAGEELVENKRFSNLEKIVNTYDIYKKIVEDNLSDFDVSHLVMSFKQKLENKEGYKWRYNHEKERFYTYKEMKAKREDSDLTTQEQKYESVISTPEKDEKVWRDHWVNLVLKRDLRIYAKKFRDLDIKGIPYIIDYENFNPRRWNENIKLVGKDHFYENAYQGQYSDEEYMEVSDDEN